MVAATRKQPKRKPARRPGGCKVRQQIPKGCFAPDDVPAIWRRLLKSLPKYDPFLQGEGCFFDPAAALDSILFFEDVLTHSEGALAGKPFLLERWQKAINANLFGWKRIDRKGRIVRRYRVLFLYLPRKNGKTPFAAGLCLYMLTCDGEAGAQISSSAAHEEQAALLYSHACGMVNNSPALKKRCQIYEGRGGRAIRLKCDRRSIYRVHTSSPKGKHGGNPHMVLVDELHEVEERRMIEAYETSFASDNRAQSMMVYITTADYDRPSICNEKHKKACRVRDNDGDRMKPGYDPSFLPVIFETEKGADWKDLEVWKRCNPNYGVSVSPDYIEGAIRDAMEDPTKIPEMCRVNLNMITQTAKFWLDLKHWDKNAGKIDLKRIEGATCFGALDLASVSDLTSLTLLFPHDDGFYSSLQRFWIPEETVKTRSERDGVPYDAWVEEGWMLTTPGVSTDYDTVREDIYELAQDYGIQTIAIDPMFQGEECAQRLMAEGFDVAKHGQGYWSMAAPTKRFEQLYLNKKILHAGNPVMRWMIGNAMFEQDAAGNRKPSKQKSTEKIDGVVTLIMSIGAHLEKIIEKKSVYESRGLIVLNAGGDEE